MSVNQESYNSVYTIKSKKFKNMLYNSLLQLKEQQSLIDSLNVFPVPDGDTGTNMYLTYQEAVEEVKKNNPESIDEITKSLAKGALMGARGNSGVILSQLLRGFSQAVAGNNVLKAEDFVKGLKKASEVAYQGVLKPVEGTILTVSRKAAEEAEKACENSKDLIAILEKTVDAAREALNKTPEQLPELKEAGVVDAGGQGYLIILEGMLEGARGKIADRQQELKLVPEKKKTVPEKELEYTYCTQTLIFLDENSEKLSIDQIRKDLQNYGNSLMVVGSDDIIKIHIHTNHPGVILEYALKIGNIDDIKIDNMKRQQEHHDPPEVKRNLASKNNKNMKLNNESKIEIGKDIGLVAVGQGKGIKNIFNELGVDIIIDGGQSMNPSTNDFVEAVDKLSVNKIIILPNNKNIISAAKQAADISDKKIEVIPTRNFPEAIASLMVFNDEKSLTNLKEEMTAETEYVKTAEITRAVKDSAVNGLKIEEGDIIGLFDGEIEAAGETCEKVAIKLFKNCWQDEDLITIYYGKEISEKEAQKLKDKLKKEFNIDEIELYEGGQPLYPYIISME